MSEFIIEKASITDIDELRGLYLSVYGDDYPLEIGTNRKVMLNALSHPEEYFWYVMRDINQGRISGSTIVEVDRHFKIGKVTGVTVNQIYRGQGIAKKLIKFAVDDVLWRQKIVNSLYATSRTVEKASQSMLLANGFVPLGLCPNARKIKSYESLTLFCLFGEGVLERRVPLDNVPEQCKAIVEIANKLIGSEVVPNNFVPIPGLSESVKSDSHDGFEFIYAPEFVRKRFDDLFGGDEESVFYPFHKANLIIAAEKSELEIFASFNKKDHYCVWITANNPIKGLKGNFKKLMFAMKDNGIYYVETLVRMDYFDTISFLLNNRFLPSAIYPAMREEDGKMYDYILLTSTMVPLDFSEADVHECFKPFINQYAKQWLHMNLSIVEGID